MAGSWLGCFASPRCVKGGPNKVGLKISLQKFPAIDLSSPPRNPGEISAVRRATLLSRSWGLREKIFVRVVESVLVRAVFLGDVPTATFSPMTGFSRIVKHFLRRFKLL